MLIYNISDFFKKFTDTNITFDLLTIDIYNNYWTKRNDVTNLELQICYRSDDLKIPKKYEKKIKYYLYRTIDLIIPGGDYSKSFGRLYLPAYNDVTHTCSLTINGKQFDYNNCMFFKIPGSRICSGESTLKLQQLVYIVSDDEIDLNRFLRITSENDKIKRKQKDILIKNKFLEYCISRDFELCIGTDISKLIYNFDIMNVESIEQIIKMKSKFISDFEMEFLRTNKNKDSSSDDETSEDELEKMEELKENYFTLKKGFWL